MALNYSLENPESFTHSAVSIGSVSTLLYTYDPSVNFIFGRNMSNETIYLNINGGAATTSCIPVLPNETFQFSLADKTLVTKNIYAICASGSKTINLTIGV